MRTTAAALILSLSAGLTTTGWGQTPVKPATPAPLKGLRYDAEFFPGANHDPAVPTPDSVLGFRLGDKPVTHAQVEAVIKAIAAKAPGRVKLFEYATSHEGRTLYYLAVSSAANIAKLDRIKADAARLADPRGVSKDDGDRLAKELPVITWMAYCIHGDEMSGTDASLAMLWHLASCTDKAAADLLENMVVLVDPLMNPDGRDRCITGVAQGRTVQPNVDDQSIFHAQPWPGGRMNHYLFDMNRDWIFVTQPESRGRVKAAGAWNPHYFVESHEQGPLDTFLMMPPRAPINPNVGENIKKWSAIFGADQGRDFDAFGWRYYTGEWNEEWYPGYSGSWACLRGAIDNLYEQARLISDGVRRPEGTIEAYREAVHKQLIASMANLKTLQKNGRGIVRDFAEDRRKVVAGDGVAEGSGVAKRCFIVEPPAGNDGRWIRLADLLETQGIEVARAEKEFTASGRDGLGREFKDRKFAAGTRLISANQPLGRFAAALFELDPRMTKEFLTEERRELLRFGQSRLYDITGWNVGMFFGCEVSEVAGALPEGAVREDLKFVIADRRPAPPQPVGEPVAYVYDGRDDRSLAAAARLMERGVKVRATDKPTVLAGAGEVARGSFFVTRVDNRDFAGSLAQEAAAVAEAFGAVPRPVLGGLGAGDLPDLGGQHFVLLETPRIAVVGRDPISPYSYGEVWHLLDHEMGIRASYLDAADLGGADLRRYNVLVIPEGGDRWADKVPALKAWVEAGGTLIAVGEAAAVLAKEKDGIGSVRQLPDVLTKLDEYRQAVVRDWLGKTVEVDPEQVWSHNPPEKLEYPWDLGEAEKLSDEEAKRRDQWRSLFMPQGALLAARVDDRSWLTSGCGEVLPVVVGSQPVLVVPHGGQAPVILGAIVPSTKPAPKPEEKKDAKKEEKKEEKKDDKDEKKEEPKPGWLLAPPGFELRLRMSGLLWPEAADRLAHGAYATREPVGAGQVILFSGNPTFRAATRGTTRLFMNAVVMGPGMGASAPIKP